ncbi:MAG: N-6 DNA methylase, partial [Candidatus Eisenbacteria bacterium]|nr:N-6 DNA methylase [Candidatus Eisenbacteria bacterium]
MNRTDAIRQIRRILLLAASKRSLVRNEAQLALPLGLSDPDTTGPDDLPVLSDLLHAFALELVCLVQMEQWGVVCSPLSEQKRRLKIGGAPALRLLQEWNQVPTSAGPAVDLDTLPLLGEWRSRTQPRVPRRLSQLDQEARELTADEVLTDVSTPVTGREAAFRAALARACRLARCLDLSTSEIEDMAKRIFGLCAEAMPEDDIAGLVHGHGQRHRLVATARGRFSFQIDRERSRGQGVFATPPELIAELARAVLDDLNLDGDDSVFIVDPACGTGAFLLAAARRLATDEASLPRLTQLHGVDLDPQAVRVAAHNLSLYAAAVLQGPDVTRARSRSMVGDRLDSVFGEPYPHLLGRQLYVGNALSTEASSFSPAFLWEKRFPAAFTRSKPGFDVVIGNPPWISYGLRDRAAADEEQRDYYQRLFPAGTQYKLTLYPLFMELAMRICREGGVHGFLVPDSVLTGHHFSRIRKQLLTGSELLELALVETSSWPGAHVGFTVFYAARRRGGRADDVTHVRNRMLRGVRAGSRRRASTLSLLKNEEPELPASRFESSEVWVPAEQYGARDGRPLRIFRDTTEMDFLRAMLRTSHRFAHVAWTYSGLIARYGQKSVQSQHAESRFVLRDRRGREVHADSDAARRWQAALLSGSEVTPYHVEWQGGRVYLPEGRTFLSEVYKSGFDLERYRRPKVFLRQTGDRLVAALDRDGLLCMNNLHLVGGSDASGVSPLL